MFCKKVISFFVALLFLLTLSLQCFAYSEGDDQSTYAPQDWAIGWQYTQAASGLSVRCPLDENYAIQPIFMVNIKDHGDETNRRVAFGLRGIYSFTPQADLRPYAGVGVGYRKKTTGTGDAVTKTGGSGAEAFFGVEYTKYQLRPALEIAMGNFDRLEGGYEAGVTFNASLMYYF